jgi:hypothetical protein
MEIIDTFKGKFKIVDDDYCTNAVSVDDEEFFYCFDKGTSSEDIVDYINHEYEFDRENE